MTRFVGAGLFVLVLSSFLMPWVSVECSGMQIQATGLDIAAGRDVEYAGTTGEVSVEPLVFLALVLAVVGAGLFFLRTGTGTIIRIAIGVLGFITLIAFKFKAESTAYSAFQEVNGRLEDPAGLITINWEVGFWIALLAFLAAAGVHCYQLWNERQLSVPWGGPAWPGGGDAVASGVSGAAPMASDFPQSGHQGARPRNSILGGARLTVRSGPLAGRSFPLYGDEVAIGRSSDNIIVLEDPSVSRHHARLRRRGSNYILEDLGSSSGTRLNGNAVQQPVEIIQESVIRMGETELIFQTGEPIISGSPQPATQPVSSQATAVKGRQRRSAWMLVQKGKQVGQSFVLQRERNTIGRGPDCDICLEDQAISRTHAILRRLDRHYLLYDMGSRGGTRLNGQSLTGATLRQGSKVILGSCELEFSMVEGKGPASFSNPLHQGHRFQGAFLVRTGPAAGQSLAVEEEVVIGRDPGPGGAVLNDPSVSRRHTFVRKLPQGYVLYELASANGTVIDGAKLSGQTLRHGDIIQVGGTTLQFGEA